MIKWGSLLSPDIFHSAVFREFRSYIIMMSVVFNVFFILLFGYGVILAFGNLYISIKIAYTIIKKRKIEENISHIPPLGGVLMFLSLQFFDCKFSIWVLFLDWPFPNLLIIYPFICLHKLIYHLKNKL